MYLIHNAKYIYILNLGLIKFIANLFGCFKALLKNEKLSNLNLKMKRIIFLNIYIYSNICCLYNCSKIEKLSWCLNLP